MTSSENRKRAREADPHPWQRMPKDHRRNHNQNSPRHMVETDDDRHNERKEQEVFAKAQTRRNQAQEAEQMREWVNKEDDFVLKQSKKKARIRVKEGRARTIDWLAVNLGAIEITGDLLEEETNDEGEDIIDPAGVFEGLSTSQLQELGKDIEAYVALESSSSNRKYWTALKTICSDYQTRLVPIKSHSRSTTLPLADVDRLLSPKNLTELIALEKQITNKLQSNEPIEVEYWEQLLQSVAVYKAKADLNAVYKSLIENRLGKLRSEQRVEATQLQSKLAILLYSPDSFTKDPSQENDHEAEPLVSYSRAIDPEPLLKYGSQDKGLNIVGEQAFLDRAASERQRILKLRFIPKEQLHVDKRPNEPPIRPTETPSTTAPRFAPIANEDFSSATTALYEREVARGVQEDEEIFAGEEEVSSPAKPQWANKYRPRKPRYFNRVQMGYEWNKYNQTHYDHENPPPKVVQGYKFNIFYPDLIDKVKAPTYRIEREGGRKRGESFAPAGEEDTCLIRFISGPPYEDLAFRIVDKEWDYSAKRERGFRSSFDKGILQLHFQFKKVYYRK